MSRLTLAIAGAVVLAAIVGLLVLLRSDAPPPERVAPSPAASEPGRRPVVPAPAAAPPDAAIDATIGERRVRDHRAGEHAADEPVADAPPPPERTPDPDRAIGARITQGLSQKLQVALQECAANLPAGSHGDRSRIQGEIRIAIKGGQATITSAAIELRDFVDAVQDGVKQCIAQHAVGLVAPAADSPDVDSRTITLSLRWP